MRQKKQRQNKVDVVKDFIDITGIEEDEKTRVFINGEIINSEGESWFEEGCLSIRDI